MRIRSNQKSRRQPHREVGVFTKRGILRVVELHPTKGFRETNGEGWRGHFEKADQENKPVVIVRGDKRKSTFAPVSNKPKVMHKKSG